MRLYLIPVMAFCFGVDMLLLVGTGKLTCAAGILWEAALAAAVGAAFGGACLLPRFSFLGNGFFRLLCLAIMGTMTYGVTVEGIRRTALFALLNLTVGELTNGTGLGMKGVLLVAASGGWLCMMYLKNKPGAGGCVPVLVRYGEKRLSIMALRDTGNTLKDPVTGEPVLVVGADVALRLLGLSAGQLADPVGTMTGSKIPGLRLIPYRSVGKACGMMLALRFEDVQIGDRCKSTLVAFAPEGLDGNGRFQALTGGMV